MQIQCAQCHDHKTEKWKQDDFRKFTACFMTMRPRPVGDMMAKGKLRKVDLQDMNRPMMARGKKQQGRNEFLSYPPAALDEPVLDRVEDIGDPDLETGLLADLPEGRLLTGFAGIGRALRQGPGQGVAIAPPCPDDEGRGAVVEPNDDAAGRCRGARPQARHGAGAAMDRRVDPAMLEPVHSYATLGRGRPPTARRGDAARIARQSPRR